MDCNLIKDRILDYIDGALNEKEENLIKEHLEQCNECSREYIELKSTIDYIEINANNIDTNKAIDLKTKENRVKPIRRFRRTSLIAVTLLFILVMTAIATDNLDYFQWWKRHSERSITAWDELLDNGVGQKLNVSVIDKDIKVTAEGVIADDLNTIILLRIEDLKGSNKFVPGTGTEDNPFSIKIGGDIVNKLKDAHGYKGDDIEPSPLASYTNLYAEEENVVRFMVNTDILIEDEGKVDISIENLSTMFNKDNESIVNIEGNWNLSFSAKKIKSKSHNINKAIGFQGNEVIIEKVIIAPTATKIQYKVKIYNDKHGYYVNDLNFSLKHKFKKYGYSPLASGSSHTFYGNVGYLRSNSNLESLYLENPKKIKLVVESLRYSIRDEKYYDIDINNLPQIIEYHGNKIIIENIIYNEDNTEIIVKEEENKDRKHSMSIFRTTAKDNPAALSRSRAIEFEGRDRKGKIVKSGEWDSYRELFINRYKLVLQNDSYIIELIEEPKTDKLIPDRLYIESQEYVKYPNKKTTIKLK